MIAVCGECLIDFIPQISSSQKTKRSHRVTLPDYQSLIGGSPLNTAVALSRLNNPVTMVGRLSRDFFGESLIHHLKLNGVKTNKVIRSDDPSTIGFVIPNKNKGEDFVFYAQQSADRFFQVKDLPQLPTTVDHLHFSSISLQMEPCGSTYEHLMKKEYRQRTISLDPNVRPLFIKDRGSFRKRVERMVKWVGVFRASDQDLKFLYPQKKPEAVLRNFLPKLRPPGIAILTLGSKGAVGYCQGQKKGNIERIQVATKKSKVIDTVGAGDSFTGALLHILYRHRWIGFNKIDQHKKKSLPTVLSEALKFASHAALINCSRKGCDPAFLKEINLSTK